MGIDPRMLSPRAQAQIAKKLMSKSGGAPVQKTDKPSKYHNEKSTRSASDGKEIKFDSRREAARFDELMIRLHAGEIRNLKLQPDFTIQEGYTTTEGERIRAVVYRADFSYEQKTAPDAYGNIYWLPVVEDLGSRRCADYGSRIREVGTVEGHFLLGLWRT